MCGAIHPLSNTPSWYGAQIKNKMTGTTLPFTFQDRESTGGLNGLGMWLGRGRREMSIEL